uniref:RRM domain-containing protein n=1 Tax=Anopheles atroparvus TaxID=41427 RepID=A0AAG5CTA9_ANOAO
MDEDVEMSTAVEVISIDPNCDYDTEDEQDDGGEEEEDEDEEEEDVEYEDEEEEDCAPTVQQFAGDWMSKDGVTGWVPAPDETGELVARNVSLTVDVAHEVIGGLEDNLDEEEEDDVGDIHCNVVAMPVGEVILPKEEKKEEGGRGRSNSCSSTASSSSHSSTSSSSSSSSSSGSTITNGSNRSSKSNVFLSRVKVERNDGPSLDFSPTKGIPFEPPEQLLQVKEESPTAPPGRQIGRRKRTSSSQRRSFSMPHSPVGTGNGIDALAPISLSFEDLDSLVLSPLKALAGGGIKVSESDLDDSLVEELANDGTFDLAEYITGDDSTTSCDTNAGYFSARKRQKAEQAKPTPVLHPKSRGKELKVLRQLMLPQKPTRSPMGHRAQSTETPNPGSNAAGHEECATQTSLNGRRSCTAKVLSRLTLGDDSSDSAEDHLGDESTPEVKKEPAAGSRKSKRKAADDAEKDPTWNPNGVGGSKPLHHTKVDGGKVQHHKQSPQSSPQCAAAVSKPFPLGNSDESGNEKASPAKGSAAVHIKGVKFGQVVRKDHPSSSTSSSTSTTTVVGAKKPPLPGNSLKPDQSRTNVFRKKTNVKLDHDYCSPKNGSLQATGGLAAVTGGGAVGGCQRKAIEIPFLLPTKDQLRHERKLQKERKRNEHTVAKKSQEQAMDSSSNGGAADNSKDKQTRHHLSGSSSSSKGSSSSNPSAVQKTPATNLTSSPVHSVGSGRTATAVVDKSFVNNSLSSSPASSDASANEVTQSSHTKLLPPTSNSGAAIGGGAVKRQVSLLKINQQTTTACAVVAASAFSRPSNDDANANHVSSPVARVDGNESGSSSPVVKCEDKTTQPDKVSETSHEQGVAVVVRRKLNLQEYKKRREHPENVPPPQTVVNGGSVSKVEPSVFPSDPRRRVASDGPGANGDRMQMPDSDKTSDRTVNVSSGYSGGVSAGLANVSVSSGTTATQAVIKQEPLDPISAAKRKALRMQQLKKEAAIKSHEAKLSQKTMPLMPIVPLAQITSLEFDEQGNPLSLDEARARAKTGEADGRDSFKLHPDYEEIVIVSVGCNTALTIVPGEPEPAIDPLVVRSSSNGGAGGEGSQMQQLKNASGKDASLLLGIKDTLKRCCPSVGNMPGSSLIASIQEVMIKKSNNITQSVPLSAAAPTAEVVSVAETAITLKTEPGTGGAGGGQEQYLLMQQSSPYVGVSPPSSFSPGKPERAHTPSLSACQANHHKQGHTIKSEDIEGTALKSVAASQTTTNGEMSEPSTAPEHGEDKIIMHLRKDRPRPPSADASTQTEPSGRFAPLRKFSPRNSGPPSASVEPRNGTEVACTRQSRHPEVGQQRSERSYRSRRRDGSESSGAESDGGRRRSHRSKSRSGRDQLHPAYHQHHRTVKREDRSRSRHGSSRRRSSRSRSGSRSRSRSTYSHRVHRDEHRDQQQHHHQHQHHGSNNGAGGHYSRGRRKSRTSSRSSSSSLLSRRGRRSMSASSSASSSSASSRSSSRSRRSRSPRSSSVSRSNSRLSGLRSATPPDQRYQSRERLNHRRPMSPERKIVYIGRLECNIRKEDLHQKFQPYGKIVKITLHSKDNGVRYGFVTFEKPQHAYSAIDASANDPNLREYDVSFGGRRAFCRMQYADLDGELSNDLDHHIPYVAMDGSLVLPPRAPIAYGGVPMSHKDPTVGPGAGGGGDSFEDLLMQFKKGIGAMKAPRKT